MDILQGIMHGFEVTLTPTVLFYCLLGSFLGTATGVLPGIGPLAGLSILLPLTLSLPPVAALAMLCSVFYGTMYGGSTTSILLRIPGDAPSIVITIDGNAMARRGRAGVALGMAAASSFIGGTVGIIAVTLFSPLLGSVALRFGPPEYCAIILLSLVTVTYMIEGSPAKAMVMIGLGIFCSTVGIDLVTGEERFTFDTVALTGGFSIVAVVIGMFGVAEILERVEEHVDRDSTTPPIGSLLPKMADWAASWLAIVRGAVLGFIFGILPGGGPVTAAFLSYAVERKWTRDPENFGKGAVEGVAGPEAANSAAVAGGMIPLLSLGVPSNAAMALLLGALIIQGIQPGPLMIVQHADVFWGVVASMYVGNIFLLILNVPLIGIWVQLLKVPYIMLFPLILILGTIGSYSENVNIFGVWLMIGFGVLGYLLRKLRYELTPFILTMVLSPLLESALRQSLIMSRGSAAIFVTRPISGVLVVMTAVLIGMIVLKQLQMGAKTDEVY
jgi:putative tricarboxylic transport membrane protein